MSKHILNPIYSIFYSYLLKYYYIISDRLI
uniref:Uncharacterized protein n=1 Tax=Myoviridae sp. ctCo31 TaxID=2825053 RepID=A0A8S5UMD6_9CAUD|nr:MAG TPA: hypothetical protein [Myoviridae sp. ctCo31]